MRSARQQVGWGKGDVYCRVLGAWIFCGSGAAEQGVPPSPCLARPSPPCYLQAKGESEASA